MSPADLISIINAGIDAVKPATILPRLLQSMEYPQLADWLGSPSRSLLCIGKAAVHSAKAILNYADTDSLFVFAPAGTNEMGLANVHYGTHPIPDESSVQTTLELLNWLDSLATDSYLLVVLSGGSSALLVSPAPGLSFESKRAVNDLLIRCGATIHEINAVRKHLSQVKGGQLAARVANRKCLVLVISDVIGDDLATIGSGPFYPDPTTYLEAAECLKRYSIWQDVPAEAQEILNRGAAGKIPETPKQVVPAIPHHVIASNSIACRKAAARAEELGYNVDLDFQPVSGLVEEVAEVLARRLIQLERRSTLIMGGEVTVRLRGSGMGGRNEHLALLMTELISTHALMFAAAGTDGIDGNSPAAGAWTDGETLQKAVKSGLSYYDAVKNFDSYHFFESLDQLIQTGPTGTNVMDLYVAARK